MVIMKIIIVNIIYVFLRLYILWNNNIITIRAKTENNIKPSKTNLWSYKNV